MTRNQLLPLDAPWPDGVAAILDTYPKQQGYLLRLFRVFANSRRFLEKGVANLLDRDSPLSMRERELVILRTTGRLGCEYEWGVHVTIFSAHVGLPERSVLDTLNQPLTEDWSDRERLLLTAVDELVDRGCWSDATLELIQQTWTCAEQLEILALAGNYHTVSFVAKTARLSPESFAARFPSFKRSGQRGSGMTASN